MAHGAPGLTGKVLDALDHTLTEWIGRQHLLFVATAPSAGGHVNQRNAESIDGLPALDRRGQSTGR